MKSKRKNVFFYAGLGSFCTLALAGILAGFFNGLLGAGGGVILILFLARLVGEDSESKKSIYANALCVMLPLSFLTISRYGGPLRFSELTLSPSFVLGAVLGGLLGGFLLGKLPKKITGKLFAALTVISGILMVVR